MIGFSFVIFLTRFTFIVFSSWFHLVLNFCKLFLGSFNCLKIWIWLAWSILVMIHISGKFMCILSLCFVDKRRTFSLTLNEQARSMAVYMYLCFDVGSNLVKRKKNYFWLIKKKENIYRYYAYAYWWNLWFLHCSSEILIVEIYSLYCEWLETTGVMSYYY